MSSPFPLFSPMPLASLSLADEDARLHQEAAQQAFDCSRMSPEALTAFVRGPMAEMPPGQRSRLLPALAEHLDDKRLAVAIDALGPDVGDLANAIGLYAPWATREAFNARMAERGSWRDIDSGVSPQPGPHDAVQARQAFIERRAPAGAGDNPRWQYRLFRENPKVMAQPLINAHVAAYGDRPIPINGRTHLRNEVARAMGAMPVIDLSGLSPEETTLRVHTQDLFAAGLTQAQSDQREAIVDQIIALGGEQPAIHVWPAVTAIDADPGGMVLTPLFEVAGAGGKPRYVDVGGLAYDNLTAFLGGPERPRDGTKVVLLQGGRPTLDEHDNVLTWPASPKPPGVFELPSLQMTATAVSVAGTALSLTGTGAPVGVPMTTLAGAYLAGGVASGLFETGSHGGGLDPVANPSLLWDYGSLGLAVAGFGQAGVHVVGSTVAQSTSKAISAANVAMAAAEGARLGLHWASLTPDERIAQAGMQGLNLAAALVGHRASITAASGEAPHSAFALQLPFVRPRAMPTMSSPRNTPPMSPTGQPVSSIAHAPALLFNEVLLSHEFLPKHQTPKYSPWHLEDPSSPFVMHAKNGSYVLPGMPLGQVAYKPTPDEVLAYAREHRVTGLLAWRKCSNVPLSNISWITGASPSLIRSWEQGRSKPWPAALTTISRRFDIPLETLQSNEWLRARHPPPSKRPARSESDRPVAEVPAEQAVALAAAHDDSTRPLPVVPPSVLELMQKLGVSVVKAFRIIRHLDPSQVAEDAGLWEKDYRQIEEDPSGLDLPTRQSIADALGVDAQLLPLKSQTHEPDRAKPAMAETPAMPTTRDTMETPLIPEPRAAVDMQSQAVEAERTHLASAESNAAPREQSVPSLAHVEAPEGSNLRVVQGADPIAAQRLALSPPQFKQWRMHLNYSREQVADALGITRQAAYQHEVSENPQKRTVAAYARLYQIEPDDLRRAPRPGEGAPRVASPPRVPFTAKAPPAEVLRRMREDGATLIAACRKYAGREAADVAKAAGIDLDVYLQLERTRQDIDDATLEQVAWALRMPPMQLIRAARTANFGYWFDPGMPPSRAFRLATRPDLSDDQIAASMDLETQDFLNRETHTLNPSPEFKQKLAVALGIDVAAVPDLSWNPKSNLALWREHFGFSQSDVAQALGISPSSVRSSELAHKPSARVLSSYAKLLGVPAQQLWRPPPTSSAPPSSELVVQRRALGLGTPEQAAKLSGLPTWLYNDLENAAPDELPAYRKAAAQVQATFRRLAAEQANQAFIPDAVQAPAASVSPVDEPSWIDVFGRPEVELQ
jgi:transcriptional regulator with XRE-family HTH domain